MIVVTQKLDWHIQSLVGYYWIVSVKDKHDKQHISPDRPDPLPNLIIIEDVLSKLLKAFATLEPETYLRLVVENEAERFESILSDLITSLKSQYTGGNDS